MSFARGQKVWAEGLFRVGEILGTANARGEYQIQVGTLTMWVHSDRLKEKVGTADRTSKKIRAEKIAKRSQPESKTGGLVSLDLHGKTVKEAELLLESTLDRALIQGASAVEIVHGLGLGKIKAAVHRFAAKTSHIVELKEDIANPGRCVLYL